jgi:hypothetical protein
MADMDAFAGLKAVKGGGKILVQSEFRYPDIPVFTLAANGWGDSLNHLT